MIFKIKHRVTRKVLFELKCESFKLCAEKSLSLNTDLTCADLRDADLRGAYLTGADLRGADLTDAEGRRVGLTKKVLQILGLGWDIIIFDTHLKIGCEFHKISEWVEYSDEKINKMGYRALESWKESKEMIISFCHSNGRK